MLAGGLPGDAISFSHTKSKRCSRTQLTQARMMRRPRSFYRFAALLTMFGPTLPWGRCPEAMLTPPGTQPTANGRAYFYRYTIIMVCVALRSCLCVVLLVCSRIPRCLLLITGYGHVMSDVFPGEMCLLFPSFSRTVEPCCANELCNDFLGSVLKIPVTVVRTRPTL